MSAEKRGASDNKTSFNLRIKEGGFSAHGMFPDFEPQDISPEYNRLLLNVRLDGGISARGGKTEIIDLSGGAYDENVSGLNDFQIGTQRSLIMVSAGCPGFSPSAGFFIGTYDTEQNPPFQRLTYYPSASTPGLFTRYGDDIFFSVDDKLMRLRPITPPYGLEALDISGVSQETEMWTVPSGYSSITAMIEHDGDLYIAIKGTVTTNSAIYRYDGVTFTKEIGSIQPITGFANFRELLVAGHDGSGTNLLRLRSEAGVWSTVAPGSGTVAMIQNNSASYKDKLYVPNCLGSIYSYDGTALTEIPFGTTGIGATGICKAVDVAYGYLYFSWYDPSVVKVGTFDGTTWTPGHKNLTSQFSLAAGQLTETIRFYRGDIVVSVGVTGVAEIPRLLFSPRENTSGTWTSVNISTGIVVKILHLGVY